MQRITVDVGGEAFSTTLETVSKCAKLKGMLFQGDFFLDRDPTHFRHVLNFLRGVPTLPRSVQECIELRQESHAYGLYSLVEFIDVQVKK